MPRAPSSTAALSQLDQAGAFARNLSVVGALVALSFFGLSGPIGAGLSGSLRFLFGMWAFAVPVVPLIIGLSLVGVCCS